MQGPVKIASGPCGLQEKTGRPSSLGIIQPLLPPGWHPTPVPFLGPVAAAAPATRIPQHVLRDAISAQVGDRGLLTVFDNAQIEERALAMPLEWYQRPHGFQDRNEAFQRVGLEWMEQAARGALAAAGLRAQDLDAILAVTTTGIATPSLDAHLAGRLGCRPDVVRMPLWGWGCAGGVAAINRAADLVRTHPEDHVLVVCLELCTLSFHADAFQGHGTGGKKALVATSLFGDGCAALVVSGDATGQEGLQHVRGRSHLFRDTQRVMGWDVRDDHMEVVLSPEIPQIVRREMGRLVADVTQGVPVDHWALHPGGARVVEAYQEALGLTPQDLQPTRDVLLRHGNMSSPTVLMVLQRIQQAAPAPGQTVLAAALGPGFASETALVRA